MVIPNRSIAINSHAKGLQIETVTRLHRDAHRMAERMRQSIHLYAT